MANEWKGCCRAAAGLPFAPPLPGEAVRAVAAAAALSCNNVVCHSSPWHRSMQSVTETGTAPPWISPPLFSLPLLPSLLRPSLLQRHSCMAVRRRIAGNCIAWHLTELVAHEPSMLNGCTACQAGLPAGSALPATSCIAPQQPSDLAAPSASLCFSTFRVQVTLAVTNGQRQHQQIRGSGFVWNVILSKLRESVQMDERGVGAEQAFIGCHLSTGWACCWGKKSEHKKRAPRGHQCRGT